MSRHTAPGTAPGLSLGFAPELEMCQLQYGNRFHWAETPSGELTYPAEKEHLQKGLQNGDMLVSKRVRRCKENDLHILEKARLIAALPAHFGLAPSSSRVALVI